MKYLYKAMESLGSDPNTQASGNVVLGWHEKVRLRIPLFPLRPSLAVSFTSPSLRPPSLILARSTRARG